MSVSLLKKHFPTTPVVAFSATATLKVQENIIQTLNMQDPVVLRGKTQRENLQIKVEKRVGSGQEQLLEFLKDKQRQAGIIYTFTRRESESVARFLSQKNYKARAYHAGLSSEVRYEVYREFLNDEIDKSNIRFVAHTSMPKTLENYYQEIGRARRDGLKSETLLLHTKADEISRLAMMDDIYNLEYKRLLTQKLHSMYRFANSSSCRHQMIASYFDDNLDSCGSQCDDCIKESVERVDVTRDARKFLSALIRAGQSFGQNHLVNHMWLLVTRFWWI